MTATGTHSAASAEYPHDEPPASKPPGQRGSPVGRAVDPQLGDGVPHASSTCSHGHAGDSDDGSGQDRDGRHPCLTGPMTPLSAVTLYGSMTRPTMITVGTANAAAKTRSTTQHVASAPRLGRTFSNPFGSV